MSLSAKERKNPPPRRKACAACIKAKRRCDAAMPACFRCEQRGINCDYGSALRRSTAKANGALSQPTPPLGLGLDWDPTIVLPTVGNDMLLSTSFDFPSQASDLSLMMPIEYRGEVPKLAPELTLAAPSSRKLEFSSDIVRNRLGYALELILSASKTMVSEMQTPWCHPLLYKYGMPRSMQDAFSSCALYLSKNPINSPIIFSSIDGRVADLIAAPPPTTFLDSLAHTQALILYQIIRLYDGDIKARISAELLIPLMERSAFHLLSFINFEDDLSCLADLPLYPIQPAQDVWESWILQESARRTFIVTFYFVRSYRVLSGVQDLLCDGKLGLCHSWVMSQPLWGALSTVEFVEAWKNDMYFVIENGQFGKALNEANIGHVDTFGRLWISSLLGLEEMQGWLVSRGALQPVVV